MTRLKTLTCPKHRGWSAAHGLGAVRGACSTCLAIWDLYLHHQRVTDQIRNELDQRQQKRDAGK